MVRWLDQQRRRDLLIASYLMVAAVAVIDFLIGHQIALSLFYIAPVAIGAYFVGGRHGLIIAIVAGFSWTVANKLSGDIVDSPFVIVWNGLTRGGVFLIVAALLNGLRIAFEQEQALARTDLLTGVANSRAFLERTELELARARRYGSPLSLVHLDLDGFKNINDTRGHAAGDAVLQSAAVAMQDTIRRTDLAARLGGDEFAILLPETAADAARVATEKIVVALGAAMKTGGWNVTFSVGLITCLDPPKEVDDLLRRADALMYRSKDSGKNRITADLVAARLISLAEDPR